MELELLIVLGVIGAVLFILVPAAVRIVKQYEAGVLFRLGRFVGVRGPGLQFIVPYIDNMVKVDMRIRTLDVPSQEMITSDTVTVRVNAVIYYRILDARSAVIEVQDFASATWLIAQTTLRHVIGSTDLDTLLSRREEVNERLQTIIDEQTGAWGIKVSTVEVKDVELPTGMQRAMARQAESERDRRAKVIHAQGEFEAAERLSEAAAVIAAHPAALQLRYLQTLSDIATDRSSVIAFPIPLDLMGALGSLLHDGNQPAGGDGSDRAQSGNRQSG